MVTRYSFLFDVCKVLISSWLSSPLEMPEIAPSWQEIYVLVCAEYKGGQGLKKMNGSRKVRLRGELCGGKEKG